MKQQPSQIETSEKNLDRLNSIMFHLDRFGTLNRSDIEFVYGILEREFYAQKMTLTNLKNKLKESKNDTN